MLHKPQAYTSGYGRNYTDQLEIAGLIQNPEERRKLIMKIGGDWSCENCGHKEAAMRWAEKNTSLSAEEKTEFLKGHRYQEKEE